MEGFFAEHWEIVATVINVMAAIIVLLGTALIRVQFRHIDTHQTRQDQRLGNLESDVNGLKGDNRQTCAEVHSLSQLLEKYAKEVGERVERYEDRNDKAHDEIRKDQQEIKGLIRRGWTQGTAEAGG